MAYKTYTTKAIVCGSKDSYTSDRSYLLFTELAGMIWASARSVRMEKSKQRCALQDFSIIRVSLVKGRGGWLIGSAEAIGNPFLASTTRQSRGGVTNVVRLLRRYVQGEETIPGVYEDVERSLGIIPGIAVAQLLVFEQIFQLRLLHRLGYISLQPALVPLCAAPHTAAALAVFRPELSDLILVSTQRATEVSHL